MKRYIVCITIFLIAIGGIGYYLFQALSEENTVVKVKTVDGKVTHNVDNPDYVGWLTIPNSNVDYPVMHTPNNQNYYLHRDIYKNNSSAGSLFMSAYSEVEGLNLLIYGHNMQNGTMFRDVYKYRDEDFFNEHKRIVFDLGDEMKEYEVFAVCRSKIYERSYMGFKYYEYDDLYNEEKYNEYISNIKSMSIYKNDIYPEYGEQLITLSTCSYHTEDGRLFIVGVERPPTPTTKTYFETYTEPSAFSKSLNMIWSIITDSVDRAWCFVVNLIG